MDDRWTERLSDYLDGELDAEERRELEAHLEQCAACTAALGELREVVARAGALPDAAPPEELWPGIAARIGAAEDQRPVEAPVRARPWVQPGRRLSFTVPQLIAAGFALVVLSGGAMWLIGRRAPPRIVTSAPHETGASGPSRTFSEYRDAQYDAHVARLEQALDEGRGRLDSSTVRILEQNLTTIRQATEEARRALAADPGNPYLRRYLDRTMRRKLELLEQATVVASYQP